MDNGYGARREGLRLTAQPHLQGARSRPALKVAALHGVLRFHAASDWLDAGGAPSTGAGLACFEARLRGAAFLAVGADAFFAVAFFGGAFRSEERRVGKECQSTC